MEIYPLVIFFLFLIVIFLHRPFIKEKILLSYTGNHHQKFTTKTVVPTTGGILILILILFGQLNLNIIFFLFLAFIFLLGILSDLNILISPLKRFFFQFVIFFIFIFISDIYLPSLKISILDFFFQEKIINYFFLTICFMILLNGSNFIDGCNTLVLGFYLIILVILYRLGLISFLVQDLIFFYFFILFLFFVFILNLFQKIFLGESGVYTIAFLVGYILVKIALDNQKISPYFIANLLWYPSFEVLFSIVRKIISKTSPLQPDTLHLHHLIFFFLHKKAKIRFANSATGLLINIYNFLILFYASENIFDTKFQCLLILCNTIIYFLIYFFLNKVKNSPKVK